jgi:hypothetical protein
MDDANRNSKNRLLQFRLRTLISIPVLVALYFAVGAYTRTTGVRDVSERLTRENGGNDVNARYLAPLLVEFSILEMRLPPGKPVQFITKSDYYIWVFGFSAKLPYHSEALSDHEP